MEATMMLPSHYNSTELRDFTGQMRVKFDSTRQRGLSRGYSQTAACRKQHWWHPAHKM